VIEVGPGEHLPLQHLISLAVPSTTPEPCGIDSPFSTTRVTAHPGSEAVQLWQVVGFDCGDPVVEALAVPMAHHFGERADVHGGRAELWALGQPVLEADTARS
jgi:hypothetical protein